MFQGCQISLELPLQHVTVKAGKAYIEREVHGRWLIVDQDCDLAWRALSGSPYTIELRAIWEENPPDDWSIRSAQLLLDGSGAHIKADTPVVHVTADVLSLGEHLTCPHPDSARRLKTWLGLRYDRAAVPEAYMALAKRLADLLKKRARRDVANRLRDVLATFRTIDGDTEYTLVAVLPHEHATPELLDELRQWLAQVALEVPEDLGRPVDVEVRTDRQVSLSFLEESYGLAVSTVSWPVGEPGPVGEV